MELIAIGLRSELPQIDSIDALTNHSPKPSKLTKHPKKVRKGVFEGAKPAKTGFFAEV
jgi:hypothetical protein